MSKDFYMLPNKNFYEKVISKPSKCTKINETAKSTVENAGTNVLPDMGLESNISGLHTDFQKSPSFSSGHYFGVANWATCNTNNNGLEETIILDKDGKVIRNARGGGGVQNQKTLVFRQKLILCQ